MRWLFWRKRMHVKELLKTDKDTEGKAINVEDSQDLTVQVASTDKAKPFSGSVIIEGTQDDPEHPVRWSTVATISKADLVRLSGYTLRAVRAVTTLMVAGEVHVTAAWR
jgi:hypothetical protein